MRLGSNYRRWCLKGLKLLFGQQGQDGAELYCRRYWGAAPEKLAPLVMKACFSRRPECRLVGGYREFG